jgi:YVTN family beta-propeller protein
MFSASLDSGLQSLRRLVRTGSSLIAVLLIAALPASSSTAFASASPDRAEPASITTVEPPPGWSAPIAVTVPGMQNPNDLAVDPYLGRLYITSRSNDHVLMLDTNTRQVVGSSPVGDMPWGVAVNPSSHRVYIANFGSDTLTVLNSQTLAHVATINLGTGARPTFVRVLSNQKVIVVLYGMSGFAVIDAEHNALERLVTTNRPGAWGLAVDPSRSRVFVSFRDADVVELFDGANNWTRPAGGLVRPCGSGGSPYGMTYSFDKKLMVACASVYGASVDTAVGYEVTDAGALIEKSRNPLDPGGANGGGGVTANANSGNTFFTNSLAGTVSVVGDLSNRVVAKLATGGDPFGAVADPVAGLVYVGDRAGNRLLIIRDDYVAGMRGGNGIAVDPADGYLYVTSRDNSRMLMVDGTTHQTIASAQLGEHPWGIALNPLTGRVYAASYDTGKLYVSATGSPGFFASVQVGWEPTFVAVDSGVNLVFVVSHKLDELWVINGANNQAIARQSTGGGTGAWGLAVNTKLKRAYVTHRESGDLVTMVGSAGWHVPQPDDPGLSRGHAALQRGFQPGKRPAVCDLRDRHRAGQRRKHRRDLRCQGGRHALPHCAADRSRRLERRRDRGGHRDGQRAHHQQRRRHRDPHQPRRRGSHNPAGRAGPVRRDRGPGPAPLPGRFEGRQQHHHHRRHGARLLARVAAAFQHPIGQPCLADDSRLPGVAPPDAQL